ncbi:MAG TPA: 4'-phosphopantetheinyl transferase superfamily protein [Stellaceae bacterium]|jgi:holo-[acyl-carrier protein] synthase|nr:4'-phosphopantetheinyl transferase superfamily protein [Stellaceae bacterium]
MFKKSTAIVGIGLDLIDIDHFSRLYGGDDPELMGRCFTDAELLSVGSGPDRLARLAARFAAKEAAYKAFGGGVDIALTDIVVANNSSGAPYLLLEGEAKAMAARKGIRTLLLSVTHSSKSAAAVVIAL